jgi:hypothetical protein
MTTFIFPSVYERCFKKYWSWGSSVSIVSDYGLDDRGFDPQQRKRIFLLAYVSRLALGLTQPPIQWVLGVHSLGSKVRPGCGTNRSPPSSSKVENE